MHSQLKTWLDYMELSCGHDITSKWSLVCIYAVKSVHVEYCTDPKIHKPPRVHSECVGTSAPYATTFVSYVQLREMQGYPMRALPDGNTVLNAILGDEDEKV